MKPSAHTATPVASEVAISSLLAGRPVPHLEPAADCELIQLAPQDGVDVLLWRGHFPQPVTMSLRDDWDRIHFSCSLRGRSGFAIRERGQEIERVLDEGINCISYTPGCSGQSSYAGSFEYVTVSVRPDLLAGWVPDLGAPLQRELDSARCCDMQRCSPEMRAAAHALSQALRTMRASPQPRAAQPPLWLLGQALVLVGLSVEARREEPPPRAELCPVSRRKLQRARDLLLADLSKAPTIAELARETGLSVVRLKHGFRQLFDHSIYGLFQQERMHAARQRLACGDTPVTVVAADLGYANASHFTAAFHKQFGVNPSSLKRRR
ncbi:helix-turn-helix domain-containing protein [Paracidovorax anthurii]|uniref:AraC family transcriptional regulator n=1 Tax=Paracidovorax anthurii TaxID=78229 RepID=A0A328ZA29_9BURK|nr:AraC family transcriptional regulator [Paracidovorax anthurii]RAR82263.1 AraC family transcriptional regulator [Paracidovorax anthurii]